MEATAALGEKNVIYKTLRINFVLLNDTNDNQVLSRDKKNEGVSDKRYCHHPHTHHHRHYYNC